jgi:predicted HAD superfamily Cof-like phosphohydrolase
MHQTPAEAVREFTFESGKPTPEKPEVMKEGEVHFICKMILDEMLELWATLKGPEESKKALIELVGKAEALPKEVYSDDQQGMINQVAAQADALVDIEYYMLNCAAKKGFNMSSIFGVVHAANMAKRNPETGRFEKNADGKVIKPPGWKPPNVEDELARQFSEGSWPNLPQGTPAEAVREFTFESGKPTPEKPEVMSEGEVHFISKMILDEMLELWATLKESDESKAALVKLLNEAEALPKEVYKDDEQGKINQVAAQADALVDIEYYMLNCAAKKGFNMSSIFGIVHGANMAKRNPETGRFEKNADGKVIKPPGWKPPNVEGELARQLVEGSWCPKVPCTPPRHGRGGYGLSPEDAKKVAPVRVHMTETSQELQKPEPAQNASVTHDVRVQ